MGRGSAYYVGLHLKRAGHEAAARFYFSAGAQLSEPPFNRLCRSALYETGAPEERLQAAEKRLKELAAPGSDEERQEREALAALHIRLLLWNGIYEHPDFTPEYLCTAAMTEELTAVFPKISAGLPSFFRTIAQGRIRVFEKRYAEAWQTFLNAFGMHYSLHELAHPALLSDIGKAGIYGADDKAEAALFFERLAQTAETQTDAQTPLAQEQRRLISFYALFYAGRCRSRAGQLEQAVRFFEQAVRDAGGEQDFDSALWYYLDTLRTLSTDRFLQALAETAASWKTPSWYADLTELLRVRLTASRDWKGLQLLYTALDKTDLPEQRAAVGYTLARSGLLPQSQTVQLLREISGGSHDAVYYRILARCRLGENRVSFIPGRSAAQERKNGTYTFSPQEAERYIDGLLRFGLYTLVYRETAACYPDIPLEKASAVAAVLEAEGWYADSIRLTALAVKNQGTAETAEQLRRLYPRPWHTAVKKYAAEYRLPEYLLYALIRSESFFQPDIVSHAGAVGLTQLMPETAADIAKKLKVPVYDLTDPETNIRFGAYYLAEMIRRSDNRIMPACFAYNAGISRVRSWQRAAGTLPDDLFLESLAYAETRGYGRKILTAAAAYGSTYYGEKTADIVRYFYPQFSSLNE